MTNRQRFIAAYTLFVLGLAFMTAAAFIYVGGDAGMVTLGIALVFAAVPCMPK